MRKKKKDIEEEAIVVEEVVEEKEIPDYYVLGVTESLKDVAEKFDLSEEHLKEINGEVIGGNQIKLK